MKTLVLAAFAAVSLSGVAVAGPGHDHSHPHPTGASHDDREKASLAARATKVPEVTVVDLAQLIADDKVIVFDANGDEVRRKFGSIPGATLLASSSGYDLSVLPAEKTKKLVFYCANPRCTAAEKAADRARVAGHEVLVLRAGIAGWVDAGQATTLDAKS